MLLKAHYFRADLLFRKLVYTYELYPRSPAATLFLHIAPIGQMHRSRRWFVTYNQIRATWIRLRFSRHFEEHTITALQR